ncbi:MAG: outer membrane beta-barrel protein [Gemmatimonadaceae bacterium]|nr:outer membrane beta-barrel protein [Gemmatimonadaceae bacterium]
MKLSFCGAAAVLAVSLSFTPLQGQGLYFGLRGGAGFPTGAFDEKGSTIGGNPLLDAAKTGFGYGADAGVQLGPLGVYAGFDHINFDCESQSCTAEGKYRLQGFAAGIKLLPPGVSAIRPWVKGGVTFNQLRGGYGSGNSTELTTDRNPGYEVGIGLDIRILGLFQFTPQARYVGQNFKYRVPGVVNNATESEQGANYYTLDLGLQFVNPLKGMRR